MAEALLINDTTLSSSTKEFDEKMMPAIIKLLEAKGALWVRINVGSLDVTCRNGAKLNLPGDPSGTGVGFCHKITADTVKAPTFAPDFGVSVFNYLKTKEYNAKPENKGKERPFETGLDARNQRVRIIDVFTQEEYVGEMEKLHTASQSFHMPVPMPAMA